MYKISFRFRNGERERERDRKRGLFRSVLYPCQDRSISRMVQIDGCTIKSLQRTDARHKRNACFVINGSERYSYANVKRIPCNVICKENIFLLEISSAPKHLDLITSFSVFSMSKDK